MLKYFVILFLAVLLVGCGDNLNPIVSEDSTQVKIEIQKLVVAKDTSFAELMGELYNLWFRVSITNLGDKEVTIDKSSFSMYDMKGSAIYSTEGVYVFDPTSSESIGVVTTAYILGINNETTFVIKPKSTELVSLFTIVSTEPTGEWNLVYGNRQVVIPVQEKIETAVPIGNKTGEEKSGNGKDSAGNQPVDKPSNNGKDNTNKENGNKEPVIGDMPMVLIPAGEFQMGTNTSDITTLVKEFMLEMGCGDFNEFEIADIKDPDWRNTIQQEWNGVLDVAKTETPAHKVFLDAFYIDVYEVTNAQYKKFVDATGYKEPDSWNSSKLNAPNQPVVRVSWYDASAYAKWAGKRLPTEAEWEKAARGGLPGKRYTWGDTWPPTGRAGNFCDESYRKIDEQNHIIDGYDDGYAYSAPVGSFAPNRYGLYDMAGNVYEWCYDWYDAAYYTQSPNRNPTGPTFGEGHVIRGGSWDDDFPAVALRGGGVGDEFDQSYGNVGFRCVMDAK